MVLQANPEDVGNNLFNYLPYFSLAYNIAHIIAVAMAFHKITGGKFSKIP
jgi:hypothetical protein